MSELAALGAKLFNPREDFRPKIANSEKRVRGVLDGHYIFDTTTAKLVWENGYWPNYWIPQEAFSKNAKFTEDKPVSGIQSSTSKLQVGNGKSVATLLVPDSFNSELAGYVKINFKDLDAWYEEMSQVLYHPKDPYHRVDILPSGRHVKVEIEGTVVADTGNEGGVMSLWETNFPGRWYLPRTAVRWEHLKPSSTKTGCPYKGQASYYDAIIDGKEYKDVVWWYEDPTQESASIRGMMCFYPDKVDTFVDGEAIQKIGMPKKPTVPPQQQKSQPQAQHQHKSNDKREDKNGYQASCNC